MFIILCFNNGYGNIRFIKEYYISPFSFTPGSFVSFYINTAISKKNFLTSIFGMLPLMLVPGVGSEIYRGLATVIVGGMCVSGLFTLLLLPSLLRMNLDFQKVGLLQQYYKRTAGGHHA